MIKEEYERGMRYFAVNSNYNGGAIGQQITNDHYDRISKAINELKERINKTKFKNNKLEQLGGYLAEDWHAGTYNIDAVIKGLKNEANVPKSNGFASADILFGKGMEAQLKYYKSPQVTRRAISETYKQYYGQHCTDKANISIYEFYRRKGIFFDDSMLHQGIYHGMYLVVPSDQKNKITEEIRKYLAKQKIIRPELVEGFEDLLNNVVDHIEDENGVKSIVLSKKSSLALAQLAQKGEFDPKEFGISLQLVGNDIIFKDAIKSGLTAATFTVVLKILPIILKSVIQSDGFDKEKIREQGIETFSEAGLSFLNGVVTSALYSLIKTERINLSKLKPESVGTMVGLVTSIIQESIKCATSEIDKYEYYHNCSQSVFVASFSLLGSVLLSKHIALGILMGNIVGSVIGGMIFGISSQLFLSLSAETGYTMFGLVDQDYVLPEYVLREMGLDLCETDENQLDECILDEIEPDMCEPDICEIDTTMDFCIKRGVIGINRIGFLIS